MQVEGFHQCLAYLVDIFGSINEVNTKVQGRYRNVLNATDSINAFKDKLKLWVKRLATGNISFIYGSAFISSRERWRNVHEIPEQLQEEFLELTINSALKNDFKGISIEHFWVQA
ncbi:protein FAM200B-like [Watersipora subatra]|uniref:protein FAM200B-like n=1 Tax=Watersipora subatra TaxID=2589382 RepID=UPI00355B6962